MDKTLYIDKADNCHHDNRCKYSLGQMKEQRRKKEQGNYNHQGSYN